jgi:hypothetical protein
MNNAFSDTLTKNFNFFYVGELQRLSSKYVSSENGVGVKEIFGMVWGSIEIIISLENSLYITADIHSIRHFGPIITPKPIL